MPHFSKCCGTDEYICQRCGSIRCSKCYPSTWRPDLTGNTSAGNVCSNCIELMAIDNYVTQQTSKLEPNKKIWTIAEIEHTLKTNDQQLCFALVKLYEFQTKSEQNFQETMVKNSVGFNGVDAKILSSMAKWYVRKKFLSIKQTELVRKKLLKYAGQLTKIANGELIIPDESPVRAKLSRQHQYYNNNYR